MNRKSHLKSGNPSSHSISGLMFNSPTAINRREFLRKSIVASAGIVVGAKAVKMLADYTPQIGNLEIRNYVYNSQFTNSPHNTVHHPGAEEGYGSFDVIYGVPPFEKNTKIVSIVDDYQLMVDSRPINSITPVNLGISLHSRDGSDIVVNNAENKLAVLFFNNKYTFGRKPVSLWRRHFLDDGKVGLELLAHVRKAIAKSPGGIVILPLPNLNGVYGSQVPYDFLQLRFDVFPGDLNLDGKCDEKDYVILGNDWKNRGLDRNLETGLFSDIDGPNGVPDGVLDFTDANNVFADRFKDANDPNTW